jgi:hypothetical protein
MKGTVPIIICIILQLVAAANIFFVEMKKQADTAKDLVIARAEIVEQGKYITKLNKEILLQYTAMQGG